MSATATTTHRDELATLGFTVIRGVIPADLLHSCEQVLKHWVEEMIAKWQRLGLLPQPPAESDFRKRLLAAWQAAGQPRYERSPRGELVKLAPAQTFNILRHPALVSLAAELLESDDIISHEIWNSRPKAPDQRFTDTPWHQDAQYFESQANRPMVNMWFPLHAVDPGSSCLAVSPSHHRDGLYAKHNDETGFIGIRPEDQQNLEEVPITMEAGDVLAFTNLTPHRAMPNRTSLMRWSMDLRFARHGDEDQWPLGQGMVARHPDASQLTTFEDWLATWNKR